MNKEKYLARRKALLDEAEALIKSKDVVKADAKMAEAEKLDARWEAYKLANANEDALKDKTKVTDIESKSVKDGEYKTIDKFDGGKNMERLNNGLELKAFQKYLTSGVKTMTDTELNALSLSGSAAFTPTTIMKTLISDEKWSDLLHRATVMIEEHAGKIKIPIASNTAASWKIENSDKDAESNSYEASPILTNLELGGYELYRWSRISSASYSMATVEFQEMILELLSAEVVETLEKSFISGTGSGQPKGLDNLTWTPGTNQKLTASEETPIGPADIATALSYLPQRYARNAIILMNADMLYKVSQFKGTQEYAFSLSDGATRFLGKEIVLSEHMADDTIYIIDPKQLYVRFAMPIQVEADRSSGFTAASIDLRALAVVDAAFNPSACVAVGLGA